MNKKIYVWAVLSVVLLVCVTSFLFFATRNNEQKLQGKLVFAKTYNQGHQLDHVEITTPSEKIVLQQKDGYWLVAGKGDYYADFSLMHNFLSSFNESIYSVGVPYDAKLWAEKYLNNPEENAKNSGMLIKTYAGDQILDEIIVGLPTEDKKYFFARRPQDKNAWLINGDFNLPVMAKDWLLRPIVEIPESAIEMISSGHKRVKKLNKMSEFFDEEGRLALIKPLLFVLGEVEIINAINLENLSLEYGKALSVKEIKVATIYGLQFVFELYKFKEKTFVCIQLATTSLPQTEVLSFIEENRFLYENWFFELPREQLYALQKFAED